METTVLSTIFEYYSKYNLVIYRSIRMTRENFSSRFLPSYRSKPPYRLSTLSNAYIGVPRQCTIKAFKYLGSSPKKNSGRLYGKATLEASK